jgi:hypothetical protein
MMLRVFMADDSAISIGAPPFPLRQADQAARAPNRQNSHSTNIVLS